MRLRGAALCLLLVVSELAAHAASGAATPGRPASLGPGDHWRNIELEGRTRSYLLHIPAKYDAKKPTPVVLIFHGAAMNARSMVWFCGMNDKSDEAGFVAVYPNGTGIADTFLTFNAWDDSLPGATKRPDDVAFTARMLDELPGVVNVDRKRIYATGMSNGGFMCYRLAAEMSDRIAAIAPVSGTVAIRDPKPKRPVPVVHFHGTADKIVPFDGWGPRATKFLVFKSVEETMRTWVKLDGCPEKPVEAKLADVVNDGTHARRRAYGPGKDGAEVVLYIIEGGGHTWPGQPARHDFLGASTKQISANDLIWEFFRKHPMP